jgi:hypothetical protein
MHWRPLGCQVKEVGRTLTPVPGSLHRSCESLGVTMATGWESDLTRLLANLFDLVPNASRMIDLFGGGRARGAPMFRWTGQAGD